MKAWLGSFTPLVAAKVVALGNGPKSKTNQSSRYAYVPIIYVNLDISKFRCSVISI